jgi:hypothetical protein
MRLAELPVPTTSAATLAHEVLTSFCSPSLVNPCVRSYLFAVSYGELHDVGYDAELLYVAAMLHDIGLEEEFDNHRLAFEHAGGHIAWVFGAGLGWPAARRTRAAEIIVRHMSDELTPNQDPEGYLLATATSLDISGRRPNAWPSDLRVEIVAHAPRRTLREEFLRCFQDQARRKPASSAADAVRSGIAERMAGNLLDVDPGGISA